MNETPSKTRQSPFVDLLVDIIAHEPNIPEGAKIIKNAMAIPRKNIGEDPSQKMTNEREQTS